MSKENPTPKQDKQVNQQEKHVSHSEKDDAITFKLSNDQRRAIETLAGKRGVRIAGYVEGGEVKIDFIAINAGVVGVSATPFSDPGMAPFIACNGKFAAE